MAAQRKKKVRRKKSSTDSVKQWIEELITSLHGCRPPLPIIIIKAHYLKSGIEFDTICGTKQMKSVLDDLTGCGEDVTIALSVLSEQASVDRLEKEIRKRLEGLKKGLGK